MEGWGDVGGDEIGILLFLNAAENSRGNIILSKKAFLHGVSSYRLRVRQ